MRSVRLHLGLRQRDVADRAGVSQRWVSEIELGRVERVAVTTLERVCAVLDIAVRFDLWWRSGNVDRLLDRDHASIVEYVVGRLTALGWEIRLEHGFNSYGDRGSVDILAWHEPTRTLLVIEVKSRLIDLQDLLSALAKKVRVVAATLPDADAAWEPRRTAYLLVALATSANRAVVARHRHIFETTFPQRAADVVAWLRRPTELPLHGLWFVDPRTVGAWAGAGGQHRVRVRREPLPSAPE